MSKSQIKSTYESLLHELEILWHEIGESESEKEKILFEIEDECRQVYDRKIEKVKEKKIRLKEEIVESEAKLVVICSVMEESSSLGRYECDQSGRSLKEELVKILQKLEDMEKRKSERKTQFFQVLDDIRFVTNEIHGESESESESCSSIDESDLSLRKLEELHTKLYALQEQKRNRVKEIQDHLTTLESLCSVLGLDFREIVFEIDPSLVESEESSRSISNETFNKLVSSTQEWHEIKIKRMQELQDLATTMIEYWNLMDTPSEEQQKFRNVSCNIAATVSEITQPNSLSIDLLQEVKVELCRLEELKCSKMRELVLKKRLELEEICRRTHIVLESEIEEENIIKTIESGDVNPENILEQIEYRAAKVKEEALSRKEILEKTEKWLNACEEENWLEEYNQDENRYNAGKGSHLILKHAEKARAIVHKLPAMVEILISKITTWESEKEYEFFFDGHRLISMLEEYTKLREEKEQERRRKRDLKKRQSQAIQEQEIVFGVKGSPTKPQNAKKNLKVSTFRKLPSMLGSSSPSPRTPPDSPLSTKSNTSQYRYCK